MKKLLALNLALVLALGLCVPALAAAEEETLDPFYTVDGEPVDAYETDRPPMLDEDYLYYDPVAAYEREHPGELESLDVDALIAGWGYRDMTAQEMLLRDYDYYDGSAEEVAKQVYIEKRWYVRYSQEWAERYKEYCPEDWAAFDADYYFQWMWSDREKEEFLAQRNILTEEEFADLMFEDCITCYGRYDPADWSGNSAGDDALTLMVNGEASDIAIAANDWTTYADADAMRALLGAEAVAGDYQGPVPVREVAEKLGWDVVWYSGDWMGYGQEVCLWNGDAFRAQAGEALAGYQQLLELSRKLSQEILFSETPKRQTETVEFTFTRFNTLDGDETYTLEMNMDAVYQKGVVDMTLTFDASQFLKLLSDLFESDFSQFDAPFSFDQLKSLLTAGKLELIWDFNEGGVAINWPLLGLLDEHLTGWQAAYLPGLSLDEQSFDMAGMVYQGVLSVTESSGGASGKNFADGLLGGFSAVAGPENIQRKGDSLTLHTETGKVNAALSRLLGAEETVEFFQRFEIDATMTDAGAVDMTVVLRPNMDVMAGVASPSDLQLYGVPDVQLSAEANGDLRKSTQRMELHIQNWGKFVLESVAGTARAAAGPRQIADVAPEAKRLWVEPAPGAVLTRLGLANPR